MNRASVAGSVCIAMLTFTNALAAPSVFDIADQLTLIPTPQEIALTSKQYALDGWSIVAPKGNVLASSGAEELNDRIVKLGGAALPIVNQLPKGPAIVAAPCGDALATAFAKRLGVTPADPGEQGYKIDVIEDGGRTLLLAIGSDDWGALYACMTARQLIQPGKDGQPALLGATVRDWPAFKRRCLGKIGRTIRGKTNPREGLTEKQQTMSDLQEYIRWLAQHKVNMADMGAPASIDADDERALMDFARRYGIKCRYIYSTSINRELQQTGNKWTDCVLREEARHCWTAFDEHRLKARKIAEAVRAGGHEYVVHHVTDSGALPDPENWSKRCARCREHYGDDQPRAVAEQLKLYHDSIKELNPDILFEAVLQPYHFQWAKPGFVENPLAAAKDMPHEGHVRGLDDPEVCRRAVERATAIHRATAAALPHDALVTFREAGTPEFLGCAKLWEGHPVDIWVYYGRNMGWEGLWSPQVRLTKSWYRPAVAPELAGPPDLLYVASVGWNNTINEVDSAAAAEYAWNINQPDADTTFEIAKRRYEAGGRDVTDFQKRSLIPRICRQLWGRAGAAVEPLFANNVSFGYIGDPEYVANEKGEALDDPYKFWDEQTKFLNDARGAINQAVADIDAGKPLGVYGDLRREYGYTSFMMLYYYANLAALKGTIESSVLAAIRATGAGRADEATRLANAMAARAPELAAEAAQVRQRMAGDKWATVIPDWRPSPAGAKRPMRNPLLNYDFAAQSERLATLVSTLGRDTRFGAIPEHLKAMLAARRVEAARVEFRNPFVPDGKRGEGGWVAGAPVEFFTVGAAEGIARHDTRAWVVWTDDALLILAELRDEPGAKPVAPNREHDDRLFDDDCLEVFVAPGASGETYYHFAVNAAGATFESQGREAAGKWNGEWQAGANAGAGMWSAELRIPFATLGATPKAGDTWRINIGRTRAAKPQSPRAETSSIIASPRHHDLAKYAPLAFVDRSAAQPGEAAIAHIQTGGIRPEGRTTNAPEIRLAVAQRDDMTVSYGFATQLRLKPEILWARQSRDVTVRAAALDGDKELAARTFQERSLPGYWSPERDIAVDLGVVVEGDVRIAVSAKAADGTLDVTREFRLTRKGQLTPVE